jgi:YVTN family beta-propeller protein
MTCRDWWIRTNGIAYVTNGGNTDGNGSVSIIDIGTLEVVAAVPLAGYPVGFALTPNGRFLYVTGYLSNTVTVFDTKTLSVVASVSVGPSPGNVAVTPDGHFAYVSCQGGADSVIDTATNTVVAAVVPTGSFSIGFNNNGKLAYSADFNAKGSLSANCVSNCTS